MIHCQDRKFLSFHPLLVLTFLDKAKQYKSTQQPENFALKHKWQNNTEAYVST